MTNRAEVLIHGNRYHQVGRICMDQFMVNAGEQDIAVGEEVVMLGDGITAEELGEWTGTNEYEVLTNINIRVPRIYLRE
jgi:alanine racemase